MALRYFPEQCSTSVQLERYLLHASEGLAVYAPCLAIDAHSDVFTEGQRFSLNPFDRRQIDSSFTITPPSVQDNHWLKQICGSPDNFLQSSTLSLMMGPDQSVHRPPPGQGWNSVRIVTPEHHVDSGPLRLRSGPLSLVEAAKCESQCGPHQK